MILDAYWNQEVIIVHFLDILPSYYHWLLVCRFLQIAKTNNTRKWLVDVTENPKTRCEQKR